MGEKIALAHGSGGRLSHELITGHILEVFDNPLLISLGDSALCSLGKEQMAFTTDSYVVKPLFFPGGDIGTLAVSGTVNDLAVMGAHPLYLSCGLIIEEGLHLDILDQVLVSMKETAQKAGIQIVTGDTKVVEKGGADGLFINTAGIGPLRGDLCLSMNRIKEGDRIILNGPIGDHGMAVLSQREGLTFESEIKSDCAPLNGLIACMGETAAAIRFMRDPTRGGLATTLNEIAEGTGLGIHIAEEDIPVRESVQGLCEILGLDPLYVANEGKVVAVVEPGQAERVVGIMRTHPLGKETRIIGEIVSAPKGRVGLKTAIGGTRIVDMLEENSFPGSVERSMFAPRECPVRR